MSCYYRGLDQQRARGATGHESEFWVEGLVQLTKSTTKYRTSDHPEILLANMLLNQLALAEVKRDFAFKSGMPYIMSFDEMVPKYRSAAIAVLRHDSPDPDTGTQLLGAGSVPASNSTDQEQMFQSLRLAASHYPDEWLGWPVELDANTCEVTIY